MEMESSHRSFDRSREQAPKKPRLADDPNSNNRPFLQRPVSASTQPRFRPPSERETDSTDSSRGTYQPQPLYGQQFEELVSQYKAALSELTFNSKPIITNLTIIAGENVHAAKAISATVCSNILEVPSEQKLPSLYLLDSIVKNIGRDYIKYFAAKLPEVFCKAYKQVDSSIHSGMRHLFGTWRGVFPSQTLQIIEKELGLPLAVNGSSSGNTASRADSHSQRPPHSIHVNPKYLEARQRLQQPSRVKRTTNDASGTMVNSTGDAERPDRLSSTGRPWTEPPVNMQNIQEPHREAATYGKNKQPPYGDYEYNSKLARNSSLGIGGRLNERIANQREDTPQHGRGSTLTESISSRKNGFDSNHRLANYQASQEANADVHLQHTRGPANISSRRSWKNSEEEEYLWDDMDSRLADQTAVSNSRNDRLILDDPENLEFEARGGKPWGTADAGLRVGIATSASLLREKKEETAFRSRSSLLRSAQEPLSTDESSPSSISARAGLWPQSHLGASSLPGRHTHELGHSLTDRNISQSRSLPRPGHETSMPSGLQNEIKLDHSSVPSQNINLSKFEPRNLPPPLMPYARPFHHVPQARREKELFDVSSQIQKPSSRISSSATPSATGSTALANLYSPTEVSGQSNTSTLLAAFINSGTFSSELLTGNIPKSSTQDSVMAPSLLGDQPPPTQFTSMIQPLPLVSLSGHAPTDNEPPSSNRSQKKVEKPPPLPPGPPPSSIPGSVSAEAPISMKNVPNPLSNLLSSLVAKGLITASKTQSVTTAPSQKSDQLQDQSSEIAATSSMPASIIPTSSAIPVSSCNDGVSISEPDFRTSGPSPQLGIKNLLGFEFRPDVIRKFHQSVISELFDDLPHGCSICGLRFKLEEGLTKHSEWHALRQPGTNNPGAASSRGWYVDPVDWVSGGPVFRSDPGSAMEKSEMQMVPADENQCVCVLCGELFEDVYCQERDEWMFKGAAYLTVPPNECPAPGLIVHASCISESSLHDLGLPVDIKVEKDA